MAQHDHPHQRRPAQGKPPRPTSVGHLALRRGGAPVHQAWPSLSRKSWAVTSWPSAPGGAAPSLGSRTRVPALHRRSTRTGPSQLRASTNTPTTPAVAARGGHSPASRSEAVYSSLGQRLGTKAQSAGHCRPGGGVGALREATGPLNAGGQGRQARQGSPRGTGHRWRRRAAARCGPALSRGDVSHPLPSRSFPVQPRANRTANHQPRQGLPPGMPEALSRWVSPPAEGWGAQTPVPGPELISRNSATRATVAPVLSEAREWQSGSRDAAGGGMGGHALGVGARRAPGGLGLERRRGQLHAWAWAGLQNAQFLRAAERAGA